MEFLKLLVSLLGLAVAVAVYLDPQRAVLARFRKENALCLRVPLDVMGPPSLMLAGLWILWFVAIPGKEVITPGFWIVFPTSVALVLGGGVRLIRCTRSLGYRYDYLVYLWCATGLWAVFCAWFALAVAPSLPGF